MLMKAGRDVFRVRGAGWMYMHLLIYVSCSIQVVERLSSDQKISGSNLGPCSLHLRSVPVQCHAISV